MGSCVYIIMIMMLLIMRMLSDNFSNIIYQLTFAPSSLTLSRSPAPRSTMVAMLSNGFPTMCMNFIGTPKFLAISFNRLILLGSRFISNEVRPPFLSPITQKISRDKASTENISNKMRVFELKFEVRFGKNFALCVGYAM